MATHTFTLPEHDWQAALDAATTAGDGRPTWAYPWPAGDRMAQDLGDHIAIAGKLVDLGCGRGNLGLTALAAGAATVLFADGSPYPLGFLDAVIRANDLGDIASTAVHQWGDPLPGGPYDVILGGDILYRPECFTMLMRTLGQSLAEDGVAWLSDPRRSLEPQLAELAEATGLSWTTKRPDDRYTLVALTRRRSSMAAASSPRRSDHCS